MTLEQAEALAASIKEQFPHVWVCALESMNKRNAPHNFFVAVNRSADDSDHALILNHGYEWQEALTALRVLSV